MRSMSVFIVDLYFPRFRSARLIREWAVPPDRSTNIIRGSLQELMIMAAGRFPYRKDWTYPRRLPCTYHGNQYILSSFSLHIIQHVYPPNTLKTFKNIKNGAVKLTLISFQKFEFTSPKLTSDFNNTLYMKGFLATH